MEILNHFWAIVVATALSLGFLVLVFVPMELVFPAQKSQKIFRSHWFLDLCFFLGQYFIWGAAVSYVLSFSSPFFSGLLPTDVQAAIQSQPLWLQAIEVVLLSDFLIYWGHRLQHKYAFLWRFTKYITARSISIGWQRIANTHLIPFIRLRLSICPPLYLVSIWQE